MRRHSDVQTKTRPGNLPGFLLLSEPAGAIVAIGTFLIADSALANR
jgi:hypothetical protein